MNDFQNFTINSNCALKYSCSVIAQLSLTFHSVISLVHCEPKTFFSNHSTAWTSTNYLFVNDVMSKMELRGAAESLFHESWVWCCQTCLLANTISVSAEGLIKQMTNTLQRRFAFNLKSWEAEAKMRVLKNWESSLHKMNTHRRHTHTHTWCTEAEPAAPAADRAPLHLLSVLFLPMFS